jgi:hypothetical protein
MLPLAAAAAFSTPVAAQDVPDQSPEARVWAPVAGVATGTLFGLSLSEAWWGSEFAGYALPASAGTAAAIGGVAGIATVALIHAATTPCPGFQAILAPFAGDPPGCVNGHYVGAYDAPYDAPPPPRRHRRR